MTTGLNGWQPFDMPEASLVRVHQRTQVDDRFHNHSTRLPAITSWMKLFYDNLPGIVPSWHIRAQAARTIGGERFGFYNFNSTCVSLSVCRCVCFLVCVPVRSSLCVSVLSVIHCLHVAEFCIRGV